MEVYSLGSGSKGNAMVVTNGKNHLLIDAGLSARTLLTKLSEIGMTLGQLDGVLVTHEHSDHIKCLSDIAPFLPVYSHPDTLEAVRLALSIPFNRCVETEEEEFSVGSMDILPFSTRHDAAHPYGYVIRDESDSVCYLTDTGCIDGTMLKKICGCKKVILESNHDKEMLLGGVYPPYLKKRILSDSGHLCNEDSASAALTFVRGGTEKIMLAHLSENNNLSELAYWTTRNYLDENGVERGEVTVKVASQKETVVL